MSKRSTVVANKRINLRWAQVSFVEVHVLLPLQVHRLEAELEEVANRVRRPRRYDVVHRLVVLEPPPQRVYVLRGVAPVTHGVEVPQVQVVLQPHRDPRCSLGDLARHERLTAPW